MRDYVDVYILASEFKYLFRCDLDADAAGGVTWRMSTDFFRSL